MGEIAAAGASAGPTLRHGINARLSALFWVVFGVGAALRLVGLNKGIWLDEYTSLVLARQADFLAALRLDDHPPLYYVLLRLALAASDTEAAARLLSVAFGIPTLLLLMLWLRRYSLRAGILGGLIGATAPILLRFSQELRSYPILLFATVLAFYFALAVVTRPEEAHNYIGLTVAFVLAVMSQLVAPAVVVMVLVYMLASGRDLRRARWTWLLAAILVPAAVFLFHYFVFSQRSFDGWWMPPLSLDLVSNVSRGLFDTDTYFAAVRQAQIAFPRIARPVDFALKMLLVLIVVGLPFGGWRKTAPLAAATASYVGLVTLITLFGRHIFWSRTLLPSLIPLVAFVAVQTTTIRVPEIRRATLAGVVGVCLVSGVTWAGYAGWRPVEPYGPLAQLIENAWRPNSLLLIYPSYIEGPTLFSASSLPRDSILSLAYDYDEPTIEAELDERLAQVSATPTPGAVFLLARDDAVTQAKGTRFRDLQAELARRFGAPVEIDADGIISLRVYRALASSPPESLP
ncbi:MAG: glycosyltransferase family 39 protein [Anaerolineae bacterium]